MKKLVLWLGVSACFVVSGVLADAPVVSISQLNQAQQAETLSAPQQVAIQPQTQAAAGAQTAANPSRLDQVFAGDNPDQNLNTTPVNTMVNLPLPQQVAILRQQLANVIGMNYPQQLAQLSQQMQQMRGQLQMQQHRITQLNGQLKTFYTSLQAQLKSPNVTTTSAKLAKAPAAKTIASSTQSTASSAATNLFSQAIASLRAAKFNQAKQQLKKYLTQMPKGEYAMNAHYWLGEIALRQQNDALAIKQFQLVIRQYPKSPRIADAKLKLAIIQASQGKTAQARTALMAIQQQYPGSTAAQLASIQLQQMNSDNAG